MKKKNFLGYYTRHQPDYWLSLSLPGIKSLLTLLFFSAFFCLSAQNTGRIITGTVKSENNESLAGVTVTVKGTSNVTTTGGSGQYTLRIPSGKATLVFTYVGYTSAEQPVGSGNTIDVSMKPGTGTLDEVVVVGYGTQKRATLTGSVSTVSAKAFQDKGVVDNPIAALQGQVPGVVVTRTSAAPGRQNWNFQIRGASSTNGADPLVIVDGVPLVSLNALNSINPADIDNMSFLKDAAAAIYGARAAGGVVLITTKRAKAGKPVIQYDGSVSTKFIGLQPHLLNVKQFGQTLSEAVLNDFYGVPPITNLWYKMGVLMSNAPDSGYLDMNVQYSMDWATGKLGYVGTPVLPASNGANPGFGDVKDFTFLNTNWVDALWGNATSNQHNLSISGRSDKSGYRLSFGFLNDASLLKWGNNSNKRYNIRLVNDYNFSDKLKVETNISLEKNDIVQPTLIGNVLSQYQQPGFPIATKTGQPYGWGTQYSPNWQAQLGGDQLEYNTRVFANLKATYAFTKHLRLIGQAGYNWNGTDIKTQQKSITNWYNYAGYQKGSPDNPTQVNSYYIRQLIKDPYYNVNAYLEYQNTFKGLHDIGVTLGTNYERDEFNAYSARTNYLGNDAVPSLNLGIGDPTTKSVTESKNHYALGSFFSRFNYAFKNKYLFEALARNDGSSRFITGNKWQFFYGFSGGWRISQENFMKTIPFINELKLRASWGVVGNGTGSGIGLYDYLQLLTLNSNTTGATNSSYPIIGSSPVVYVGPTSGLPAPDRKWERIKNTNFAVDFSVLKSRLNGTVEYFMKDNVNMLLAQQFTSPLGATAPTLNLGDLHTWGWEGSLGWTDHIGKFTYRIGGTLTDNQNKLIRYNGNNIKSGGFTTGSTVPNDFHPYVETYPTGSYFGLQYAGRILDEKTRDEYRKLAPGNNIGMPLITSAGGGVQVGDNMYVDVNGDGKITLPEDLVYLGRDDPRYTYAFNLGGDYKGFDFSVVFQGVGERTIFREGNWRVPFGSIFQGQSDYWYGNTYSPTNTGAYFPTIHGGQNSNSINNYNYQISSWSVENGAYIRLKNLVVGYTLPQKLTEKAHIEKLRVYFSGSDLWEKTHIRDGFDPEATRSVGRANQESGITRYPFYRLMTFGVNVTF